MAIIHASMTIRCDGYEQPCDEKLTYSESGQNLKNRLRDDKDCHEHDMSQGWLLSEVVDLCPDCLERRNKKEFP